LAILQQQQQNNRGFPSHSLAKLCDFCVSPSWIEYDHDQKMYVDMNTQKKHLCPSLKYRIANNGHNEEFTEEQAIVERLNHNWKDF
jgi:hypothetical protein